MATLSRALLLTQRAHPGSGRRRWTPDDVERLESLVGTLPLTQIALTLGRSRHAVSAKLQRLGYAIRADVTGAVGLTASDLARRLDLSYCIVNRSIQAGELPASRHDKKDFLVAWKDVRRYERLMAVRRQRRERVLARIQEPTISKQAFMLLLGIGETQAQRYLKGKIVRAWKVPCQYSDADRSRWEWRVSQADAERVKRLRSAGRLRLGRKAFRSLPLTTAEDMRRRRLEGRLGKGSGRYPRKCVVPGHFSVTQAAEITGLPAYRIYGGIQSGAIPAQSVRVGRRSFLAISPDSLAAFLKSGYGQPA